MSDNATIEETEIDVCSKFGFKEETEKTVKLLIHNDEVNDMDYVVESLVSICNLTREEATIVMLTAHIKGKAIVKTGSLAEMTLLCNQLNIAYIYSTIEE
jgi:ATP-dependent Clp protease adapter protein ClpS